MDKTYSQNLINAYLEIADVTPLTNALTEFSKYLNQSIAINNPDLTKNLSSALNTYVNAISPELTQKAREMANTMSSSEVLAILSQFKNISVLTDSSDNKTYVEVSKETVKILEKHNIDIPPSALTHPTEKKKSPINIEWLLPLLATILFEVIGLVQTEIHHRQDLASNTEIHCQQDCTCQDDILPFPSTSVEETLEETSTYIEESTSVPTTSLESQKVLDTSLEATDESNEHESSIADNES